MDNLNMKPNYLGLDQPTTFIFSGFLNFDILKKYRAAFLNRRDLETFLPGLETFLKLFNKQILPWISLQFLILVIKTKIWTKI
jgi:hypothetical protein